MLLLSQKNRRGSNRPKFDKSQKICYTYSRELKNNKNKNKIMRTQAKSGFFLDEKTVKITKLFVAAGIILFAASAILLLK